ncbi:MAG: hypothetical protein V4619_14440 [Bacteroidota bacterium]
MKHLLTTIILMFILTNVANAQWVNGTGKVTYTGGKVGIGTTGPSSTLTVVGGAISTRTSPGQYTLGKVDSSSTSPLNDIGILGLTSGDMILRSYWGVSIDLNDGLGDPQYAFYSRIPLSSSFTVNSRANSTSFNTLFTVRNNGRVGIGTRNPDEKLTVKGTIHAEEIKIDLSVPPPDYVFNKDYPLLKLSQVQEYIDKHHHLPEVPAAAEIEKEGLKIGEMNVLLLKKIEELTLYIIDQNKRIEKLETMKR